MRIITALLALAASIGIASAQIGPPPSSMTGNAYAGRCNMDGTTDILPSANWACVKTGTGAYRVNIIGLYPAYRAQDYAIVVSISGNWKGVVQAYAPGADYYSITIFDQAGAAMDASFGFVVTRNATVYP